MEPSMNWDLQPCHIVTLRRCYMPVSERNFNLQCHDFPTPHYQRVK
jgi:hypothetical protein